MECNSIEQTHVPWNVFLVNVRWSFGRRCCCCCCCKLLAIITRSFLIYFSPRSLTVLRLAYTRCSAAHAEQLQNIVSE